MRWVGAGGLALAALGACAEPTAIDVEVHSELGCAEAPDVLVFGGKALADLSGRAPSASATRCDPEPGGGVHRGRVVIVPTADEPLAFALTTRSGGDSSTCLTDPTGCVIAKRALRPIARRTLSVRVDLRRSCIGVPCGVDETCDQGRCVPAATQCTGGVCALGDGGAADGGVDASTDGGDASLPTVVRPGTLALGLQHTCHVVRGTVRCWGANADAQLGDGTTTDSATPRTVLGLSLVDAIGAGDAHTCVSRAGDVLCWGSNAFGQIGDGTSGGTRTAPTLVLTGTTGLAVGAMHGCALVGASELRCWGRNEAGQIGDGTTSTRNAPVVVPGSFLTVSAGQLHTCSTLAIDVGPGFTRCWGYNASGQVGDGTTIGRPTPTVVSGLPTTPSVVSARGHSCAVAAGQVYCWGANGGGQLGDGTTTSRSVATPVVGLPSPAVDVSAGAAHTCARLANGEAWCWGANGGGQIGDGTTVGRPTPTRVLGGVADVVAGAEHTCALLTTGGLRCWGQNGRGQLGDGTTTKRTVPTIVQGSP